MAILNTIKKGYMHLKVGGAYIKLLPRTLATLVSMSDGRSVENAIDELNRKLAAGEERTTTLNGWAVKYRYAGAGYMYVDISRTVSSLDNGSDYEEISNLPFSVPFKQSLPIVNTVSNAVIGSGMASFDGTTMRCRYEKYTAAVSNAIFGLLRVA